MQTKIATPAPAALGAEAAPAPATAVPTLPRWLEQVERQRAARAAHFFVLHGNISDYVYDGAALPCRLLPYLVRHLQSHGYARVGTFNLSRGLVWDAAGRAEGLEATGRPSGTRAGSELIQGLRQLEQDLSRANGLPTAVILEHLDHLAPHAPGGQDREAATVTEILVRIALHDGLRAAPILVVGLTPRLEAVASDLVDLTAVAAVAVSLPDVAARQEYVRLLASADHAVGLAPLGPGLSEKGLVQMTQGLPLEAIEALNREARLTGGAITYDAVRERKQIAIEQHSGGILESLEPRLGFDAIGGLAYIIEYLQGVVENLRMGRQADVPKGILLAGPPGTGKTLVAEALATEAGFNLVRLGDVRTMWLGESERNLSLVLRLLLELEPVVVLVDEVDQMLGTRDLGQNADSGVSARLFGRILNFMGRDETRGRVLWIGATNRPDLLDEAMVRRFDRVFPLFVPGPHERERIFHALQKITGVTYAAGLSLDLAVGATAGLTGSALELIVRRAREFAASGAETVTEADLLRAVEDYKPNHDPAMYELQSLLALDAANLFSSLPADEDLPDTIRPLVARLRLRDRGPLVQRLHTLRAETKGARCEGGVATWTV